MPEPTPEEAEAERLRLKQNLVNRGANELLAQLNTPNKGLRVVRRAIAVQVANLDSDSDAARAKASQTILTLAGLGVKERMAEAPAESVDDPQSDESLYRLIETEVLRNPDLRARLKPFLETNDGKQA